jgi:polyhydroxyalkanoate synthesis regulator phasin
MQLTDVMKSMEATLEKLTPAKAQAMARQMMGGEGREQVSKRAQDLMEWSQKNRDRLRDTIQREVRSQLKAMGVATREEIDSLRKRVRELERQTGGAKRTTTKKTTAKRSAAKRSTTAKATSASSSRPKGSSSAS